MSKIDIYHDINNRNTNSIIDLRHIMRQKEDGTYDVYNDKGGMNFYNKAIWESDIKFYCHASYGFYGSSSGYAVGGENIQKYFLQALNSMKETIIKKAIELMQKDIEEARINCIDEAKAILEKIKEE